MTRTLREAAFRATTYRVTSTERVFDLRIGQSDPAFDAFVLEQAASAKRPPGADQPADDANDCWAIVTAYNPGRLCSDQENCLAQARLLNRLIDSGRPFLAARNLADGGSWPVEPSYLVLRVDAEEALALASDFAQLAVVWGRTGSTPQLLWT